MCIYQWRKGFKILKEKNRVVNIHWWYGCLHRESKRIYKQLGLVSKLIIKHSELMAYGY